MTSPPVLPVQADAVSVRYHDEVAVRSVSIEVPEGEVLALAGPNGSGKSSFLRALTGLEHLSGGSVRILGRLLSELSLRERARALAWMPQEEPLGDNVPVRDYVRYGRFAHIPPLTPEREADERAVTAALADADVTALADRGMLELSGGERQRARLARVLAQEAPILLLDEATAHLDVGHQLDLLVRVRRIARRDGRAVIVALHDLNLAARFADRVAVLSHGQLVAEGTPSAILSPELLARVWGVVAELRRDAATGLPYLIPQLPLGPEPAAVRLSHRPRVHVVAGGGTGVPYLRRLVEAGYEVTAGALSLFDSDTEAAESLGVSDRGRDTFRTPQRGGPGATSNPAQCRRGNRRGAVPGWPLESREPRGRPGLRTEGPGLPGRPALGRLPRIRAGAGGCDPGGAAEGGRGPSARRGRASRGDGRAIPGAGRPDAVTAGIPTMESRADRTGGRVAAGRGP